MKEQKQDYFDFESCDIFKGYPPQRIQQPDNMEDYEKIKIAGFGHIKHMIKTNNTDEISYSYFRLGTKHKKNYCYVKQNDIILPVLAATNNLSMLYVENEPDEKILYNATVLVIRTEDSLISKYLYIMLNSDIIQQSISKLAYREKAAISYRMSIDIIKSIKIPMMNKDKMKKIVNDYDKLQRQKVEIQEKEKQFWQNIDTLEEIENLI